MTRLLPRIIPLAIMAAIILGASPGTAGPLPPLIDFQSVLLDEGGNLLPSGSTSVQFQILDENRAPIYTETQFVDVVKGAASALIGNGTDDKGISTGGIPDDIFANGAPRYLQVHVAGHAPEDPMTIVPVPYAQWSQTCANVADGGVTPASIAKAAVGFEALAPDVVSKLAEQLSQTQGMMTAQALNASGGASQIGLQTKLINSGSTTVQGALQDIDLSVKKRQEEAVFLTGKLGEEVVNRTAADGGLQTQISAEAQTRGTVDSGLNQSIVGINNTLSDINKIPEKLKLDKLDPDSSATSDLNMGGKYITNIGEPIDGLIADSYAATRKYVNNEDQKLQSNIDVKLSKSGGTITGGLSVEGNLGVKTGQNIVLGGTIRFTWPGFKTVYKKTSSNSDVGWMFATATCNLGDVLIGCSGEYPNRCWGDKDCGYYGAAPNGNNCKNTAWQDEGWSTLYAYAICGTPY